MDERAGLDQMSETFQRKISLNVKLSGRRHRGHTDCPANAHVNPHVLRAAGHTLRGQAHVTSCVMSSRVTGRLSVLRGRVLALLDQQGRGGEGHQWLSDGLAASWIHTTNCNVWGCLSPGFRNFSSEQQQKVQCHTQCVKVLPMQIKGYEGSNHCLYILNLTWNKRGSPEGHSMFATCWKCNFKDWRTEFYPWAQDRILSCGKH